MGNRKTALLALVGGLSGFAAWLIVERMVAPFKALSKTSQTEQAFLFGWFGHSLFGSILAGSLAFLVFRPRTSLLRASMACITAACLGGMLVTGADAISDVTLNGIYGDSYWLDHGETMLSSLAWNVVFALVIALTIAIATTPAKVSRWWLGAPGNSPGFVRYVILPTKEQLARALVAGVAAGLLAFLLRTGLALPLHSIFHVVKTDYNEVHNGRVLFSPWHPFSPARLADFVGLGTAIGLCVGVADSLFRKAFLRVMLDQNRYRDYPIEGASNRIGSSESINVPLPCDRSILSTHAKIDCRSGVYSLTDCMSASGTYLNGNRIQQARLKHGDVIAIGPYAMQFLLGSPSNVPLPGSTIAFGAVDSPETVVRANHRLVDHLGNVLRLQAGTTKIGRDPACTVHVSNDNTVSRAHAQIVTDASRAMISDLGSTSGTMVNGVTMSASTELADGDKIKMGQTEFVYFC